MGEMKLRGEGMRGRKTEAGWREQGKERGKGREER